MTAIRALTFDLDDTLWDVWPVIERAEARLHAWLAEHHPRMVEIYRPSELRALCREIAGRHPHLDHNKTALRIHALRLAAQRAGCDPALAEPAFAVFHAARQEVEFYHDVLPVLERLSRRYTLGALSNGNADVHLVGLGHVFDFHLAAADVGVAKPAAPMFERACRLLGMAPAEIVHVGDDPQTDIWGAAQVGMRTVWVNRGGRQWPQNVPRADAEIRDLSELEPLLERFPEP
jgi:putative hydrolase of the HAD superfamily